MVIPIVAPRTNANDDEVHVVAILTAPGARVAREQCLMEIETEKSVVEILAPREGYLLRLEVTERQHVPVGTVLAWLGEQPDEALPAAPLPEASPTAPADGGQGPTLKARALLAAHGLAPDAVPRSGARLAVRDVLNVLSGQTAHPATALQPAFPLAPGRQEPLMPAARAMARTVSWQREAAVAYMELRYEVDPWTAHARAFAQRHRLLSDPLVPLLAQRLAVWAASHPHGNATLLGEMRHVYDHVNLAMTTRSGDTLHLVVVPEAETLDPLGFVQRLAHLQRQAFRKGRGLPAVVAPTIGFSSLSSWAISRHMPILPPHGAVMIGHAQPPRGPDRGVGTLGASYDHRLLAGHQVAELLEFLSQPSPPEATEDKSDGS
ncbi:MAG: 2-oxo acid dehydrogenase subunit E2 [Magnetococcales bacterium]|nr:2-oxo acid dehydrogenase subunit E2 [Magnetococcales bacterium]